MELGELEKAVRAAFVGNSMQPAMAALAGNGAEGVRLPVEFGTAIKSLAGRLKRVSPTSILHAEGIMWA